MSGPVDLSKYGLDDLYTAKRSIMEARYAIAAMFCLQIYEWTAGMEKELQVIHKASWTTMKALYLCCRYYPLSVWILITWAYVGDHDVDTCNNFTRLVHALIAPCQFFAQAVMLIRAVAFSGQDLRVVALLGSCYLGLVGIDVWVFCVEVDILPAILFTVLGGTGCFPNYGNEGMGRRIGLSMLAATLMDLISLLVVVVYCLRSRWDRNVSLARYFMNQGLYAFALISIVNVATAVSYFRLGNAFSYPLSLLVDYAPEISSPPSFQCGVGLPMIVVVSNIMACRIILQLRSKALPPTDTELSRRHAKLVYNAFLTRTTDTWT